MSGQITRRGKWEKRQAKVQVRSKEELCTACSLLEAGQVLEKTVEVTADGLYLEGRHELAPQREYRPCKTTCMYWWKGVPRSGDPLRGKAGC